MTKLNFSQIQNIKVDCIISFGKSCRVAEHLRRNNLRFCSSPFDWLGEYTLEDTLPILKNPEKNFFSEYKFYPQKNTQTSLAIIDTKTGMVCVHDFKKNLPEKINHVLFRNKYKRRFKNLEDILTDAQNMCIITNHVVNTTDILNFIEQFLQLYTFEHLYYINIFDTKDQKKDENLIVTEKDNITIFEYSFNDEHTNGRDKEKNPDFWLGNIDYWNKILSKIKLNKEFVNKHIKKKTLAEEKDERQ